MGREERVRQREVLEDERAIPIGEPLAVAESERREELARSARADRRVELRRDDRLAQCRVTARDPARPEAREAVGLRDGAERHRTLVEIACRGEPVGRVVLELAVDLVAEQHRVALGAQLHDPVEHRTRHLEPRRVVRRVHVDEPRVRAEQPLERLEVVLPSVGVERRHSSTSAPVERATASADS